MTHISKDRARAEAAFKKLQRVPDSEKAKTEYEAESQSLHGKTARLRALRLAKEAIESEPPVNEPDSPVKEKAIATSDKPVRF
jgi:hypothetical protein